MESTHTNSHGMWKRQLESWREKKRSISSIRWVKRSNAEIDDIQSSTKQRPAKYTQEDGPIIIDIGTSECQF